MTLGAFGLGYLQKALGQCRYRAACTKESLLRLDWEYFSAGLCQRGAEQQSCQDLAATVRNDEFQEGYKSH